MMAEPEVRIINSAGEDRGDVEMQGGEDLEIAETGAGEVPEGDETINVDKPSSRTPKFVHYLKSPIITLTVGSGDSQTTLTAHQALLIASPYFASAIAADSRNPNRVIDLVTEDLEATSAVLEYLYTGEYFPHKISSTSLQSDPSIPPVDHTGEQLLKHAKVYTLAEKLGMPQLRTLAHSKIHLVDSNAVAELVYARYVYSNTSKDDITIRKPVATFWGQRSHVLRHETEGTFRELCLQYPEFGFDVLNFVLDAEERREERKRKTMAAEDVGTASTRKRTRG
ncbi:MAG: hypothetical protein Q9163_003686 [Psora crenata]